MMVRSRKSPTKSLVRMTKMSRRWTRTRLRMMMKLTSRWSRLTRLATMLAIKSSRW